MICRSTHVHVLDNFEARHYMYGIPNKIVFRIKIVDLLSEATVGYEVLQLDRSHEHYGACTRIVFLMSIRTRATTPPLVRKPDT